MVHASWRCTVAQNTRRLVELMVERFGGRPENMRAGIGPGAGPEQYEVREDVYEAAAGLPERESFFIRRDDRMNFDLWAANQAQLCAAGVPAEQVDVAGICTMTRTDVFFSYRREGPGCGHFGLLAALRPR
jgi:copper oxidase (laccase) domain-containing protein